MVASCSPGVSCPPRVSYQPDQTLGDNFGGPEYSGGGDTVNVDYVGQPTEFVEDCCPQFALSHTFHASLFPFFTKHLARSCIGSHAATGSTVEY